MQDLYTSGTNVSMQEIKNVLPERSTSLKQKQKNKQISSLSLTHYQSPSGNYYVINTGAFLHIPANVAIWSSRLRGNVEGKRVELSNAAGRQIQKYRKQISRRGGGDELC